MKAFLIKLLLEKVWDNRKVIIGLALGVALLSSFFSLGLLSNSDSTKKKLQDLHCDVSIETNYALDLAFLIDNIKTYNKEDIDYLDEYLIVKSGEKCSHINRISKALSTMVTDGIIIEEQMKTIYNMQLAFRKNIEEMEMPYKEFKIVQQDFKGVILESTSTENHSVTAVLPGEVVEVSQFSKKTINIKEEENETFTNAIKIKNSVYAGKNAENESQIYEYYTYIIGFDRVNVKKGDTIKTGIELGSSKKIYWQLLDEKNETIDLSRYVPELKYQLEVLTGGATALSNGDNERLLKMDRMVPVVDSYQVTAVVGWYEPFGNRSWHNGIDLASPLGTTIVSATDGKVVQAGYQSGFGNYVYIENNGIRFIYAHLKDRAKVNVDQQVVKGQVIGYMGTTGYSTGVHLHFEIRDLENEYSVIDPELYFKFQ